MLTFGTLASCDSRRIQTEKADVALLLQEVTATVETVTREEPTIVAGENDSMWWLASRSKSSPSGTRFLQGDDAAKRPRWSAVIPGRGYSTPAVVGDHVFVTSADDVLSQQMVVCFNRISGKQLWSTTVLRDGFPASDEMHQDASNASPTPAAAEGDVYAVFLNGKRIVATSLDVHGKILWQTPVGSFSPYMGYASSPTIIGDRLVISGDDGDGGFISALDRGTGKVLWRKLRPNGASHSSPTVMRLAGADQIVLTGLNTTKGFSPRDGSELWSVDGPADTTVGTGVNDDDCLFVSGGYPQQGVICARVMQSALGWETSVLWTEKSKVYVPSLLLTKSGLLAVSDNGVATLFSKDSGKTLQRLRLTGNFYASPVQHGDFIYVASRDGIVHVLSLADHRLTLDSEHHFNGQIMATPVVSERELLLRVTETHDGRLRDVMYSFPGGAL